MTASVYVLGLTGSIASGKSTAAGYFRAAGIPVWDADKAVARIYAQNPDVITRVSEICPEASRREGGVDRDVLRQCVRSKPSLLGTVEAIVHPHVRADRDAFIRTASESGNRLVVCEIPLLFETGAETSCDGVLAMMTSPGERRRRVLARQGMTDDILDVLLARQVSDEERLSRADFVIESESFSSVERDVRSLIDRITRCIAEPAGERLRPTTDGAG